MPARIEFSRCPSLQPRVHRLVLDNLFLQRRVVLMPIPAVPPKGEAQLNDNARTVIGKRYLVKDATGAPVEQPEDMFWRVAGTVAEADRRYGSSDDEVTDTATDFYRLMVERRFEPNSPTLMNAGRPLGQGCRSGSSLRIERC